MTEDGKANFFLLYFIALTAYLYFKVDYVASLMSQSPLPIAFAIHLITNPAYLLIVFGLVYWRNESKMKAFLAGILLVVAIDIISLPRLGAAGFSMADTAVRTNIDSIVALAAVNWGMSYGLFRLLYYVVLPLGLIYLSVKLLGMRAFWNKIRGMG